MPLPSGLPDYIDDREVLVRFVIQSNWLRSPNDRARTSVKPVALMPNMDGDGMTSVYRRLESIEWNVGHELAARRKKSLYGAAELVTEQVRSLRLDAIASEPPPKHANIVGWVGLDDALAKSKLNDCLIELAEHTRFHWVPEP